MQAVWLCCVIPNDARTCGGGGGSGDAGPSGVFAPAELCGSGVVDCRRTFLLFLPMGRCCRDYVRVRATWLTAILTEGHCGWRIITLTSLVPHYVVAHKSL